MRVSKRFTTMAFVFLLILSGLFYFRYQVYYSHGLPEKRITISINKGEGVEEIARKLEKEKLITSKIYFYYYLKTRQLGSKIMPGDYVVSGNMTIPDIVSLLTTTKDDSIRVTFPEGWTSQDMATRLEEKGLDGKRFLELVNKPELFRDKHEFLQDKQIKSLEGYLFPDTYFFKEDISPENIISIMLNNFNTKVYSPIKELVKSQNKTFQEVIIMSSIVEMEVKSKMDREVVSGIFWNRLAINMPLQSDTTLSYILGIKKRQYSFDDSRTASPYNTYINKGLPPGPISNPGLEAILATINYKDTPYVYFLSDPDTGETVFARTLEEHVKNKSEHGL